MSVQSDARMFAGGIACLNPDRRFACCRLTHVVGVWDDEAARFVAVFALAITGQYVRMPFEIRANGELPARDWQPVE